ncbi:vicianin hydrolase-like [Cucurbita moschata]|uniref:Vicianin hydrolase-like n=1 Tax=Cucurbita moschata TaxID=3662 RepID=A0A6J1H6Q8_CUCMO|nr:vicianin hydrolase-like [Cucurbita moschata]
MAAASNAPVLLITLIAAAIAGGALADGGSSPSVEPSHTSVPFNRSSFPAGFLFGAGSAAYQLEGAASKDGRGPSIWDTFTRNHPEKIWDHSSGEVATDFYHRYKEDVQIMKKMGLDSFRFSISWSRILPKGTVRGGVNPLGVKFYNNLINELLANGIIPYVTLFHWDLPQALEDKYDGFRNVKIVNDFRNYADLCFKLFGDRVKYWTTLNEPYSFSAFGYNSGTFAPGRCSNYVGNCTAGNSGTEPYIVAHNLLLSHAAAVKVYRTKYQAKQKGKIGITLVTHWFRPKRNTPASRAAANRALDFFLGWFLHPITYGTYPKSMRQYVGDRLPKFSAAESKSVKGSMDFLGMNYYTGNFADNVPFSNSPNKSYSSDAHVAFSTERDGVLIGPATGLNWLYIYPEGIRLLLKYVKAEYKDPVIYITENGMAYSDNMTLPIKEALKDGTRIKYHHAHLASLLQAIKEGVNVKGYYAWTFLDDFEWDAGYTVRFGLVYIDFRHKLGRYLKYSAYWLKRFLLH